MTTFDGRSIARGWLSVSIAAAKDPLRPALDRTVSIEAYSEGVRLVSTDSYVLLKAWVPNIENDLAPEPEIDEVPYATAIAMDPHGRARGFCAHVMKLADLADKEKGGDPVEVRMNLGVVDLVEEEARPAFEGMEARYVVLELPNEERHKLYTVDTAYPSWRAVLAGFAAKKTATVALNPEIVGRLAKLGKVNAGAPLLWTFGGADRMAWVEVADSFPRIDGAVMPVRWDFDRNAPRDDEPPEDETSEP